MKKLLFIGLLGLVLSLSIVKPCMATGEFTEVSVDLEDIAHSSVVFGDYDNDGDLDLLLAGVKQIPSPWGDVTHPVTKIYRNDDGNYVDIEVSIIQVEDSISGWFDYDNDGDLDIFISGEFYGNYSSWLKGDIYRNDGNDVFVPITPNITPMSSGKVAFGDYDNDGDVDILLIGRRLYHDTPPYGTKLYRNDSGAFTEVTGLGFPDIAIGGLAFGDYNNDGYLDILMSGREENEIPVTNLYRSDPDPTNPGNRIFTEITASGLSDVKDGDLAFGDYNNDGYLDILLNGYQGNGDRVTKLYRSDPDPANSNNRIFTEIVNSGLLGVHSSTLAFGDYNNDGYLDILFGGMTDSDEIVTKLYRSDPDPANPNNRIFTEIITGLKALRAGDFIWGDTDNDGDLDMLLTGSANTGNPHRFLATKLYRNELLSNTFVPNVPPDPPSMPTSIVNGSSVTLSWQKATDLLTPQDGLSYNIFIGTSPNLVDTFSPMAQLSNGWRKISALGSQNQNTSWIIKNLALGTYYWGVQAIDTSFLGSPFALSTFTIGTTYTISGTVTLEGTSTGLGGVTIIASSIVNGTASTEPDGTYVITGVPSGWTGTITASCTPPFGGYTFSGPIVITTPLTGPLTEQDFIATPTTWTISGMVTLDGVGLSGIDLYKRNTSNILATTGADPLLPSGFYKIFDRPYDVPIEVAPYSDTYTFEPTHMTYSGSTGNQENQDYVATLNTYTISGRVTLNGEGLEDVDLRDSQQNLLAITGPGGYYVTMPLEHGWPETVTPHFNPEKYIYDPVNRSYNLTANQVDQDYTATLKTFTISGAVSGLLQNNPYTVTITATGTNGSLNLPDAYEINGSYSIPDVPYGWEGELTASSVAYEFTPPDILVTSVTDDLPDQDFTADLKTFTISGNISGILSPNNPYDITITAANSNNPPYGVYYSFSDIDATDGSYSIPDVPYGWEGDLIVTSAAYNITPDEPVFNNGPVTDHVTQDYTAVIKRFTISGNISGILSPNNPYDITIAAESSNDPPYVVYGPFSIIAATDGSYSIPDVPYGWEGKLSADSEAYNFDPTEITVASVTDDLPDQDFAATLKEYTIKGAISGTVPGENYPVTLTAKCTNDPPYSYATVDDIDASDGNYDFTLPHGWDGKLIAQSPAYELKEDPEGAFISPVTSPQEQNYVATLKTCTVSGDILGLIFTTIDPNHRITIRAECENTQAPWYKTVTADATYGSYTMTLYYGWQGTLVPESSFYNLTEHPMITFYSPVTSEDQKQDYIVISNMFTISGTVHNRLSPNDVEPMAGVSIIDMETQKELAVTDNAGEYSFDKDSGWSGRVKPRKDPYRFSPTERTYEDLSRDMPGEDYDAYYNTISTRR